MLLAWVVFPLVLALVTGGWGLLCREVLGLALEGTLVVPFGFAAVIVVTGLLTASPVTAPATVVVVAAGAVAGLVVGRGRVKPDWWPVAVAVGALLAFGAPILLSGQATFAGYIRLDDTATWLGIVDRVIGHGDSLSSLPPSTYALNLHAYLDSIGYPIGAFLPLGVGRALTGADAAWVFQPYLACCGAMLGLSVFSIARRLIGDPRLGAVAGFLAAQPALLYGYSLWGGIKELVAASLLPLLAVAGELVLESPGGRRRSLCAFGVVAAALAGVLGPGAVAWLLPGLGAVCAVLMWRARGAGRLSLAVLDLALLGAIVAVLMLPVWLRLSSFIAGSTPLFSSVGGTSSSAGEGGLVSLFHPLSVFQLAGVWPVGDFRLTAPAVKVGPFVIALVAGGWLAFRYAHPRRGPSYLLYPAVALGGALIVWLGGSNPWVVAKALAIGSPALPAIALIGGGLLVSRHRSAGVLLIGLLGVGILWSNALAYSDAMLAPRARLAELQRIAPLVAGRGPTLINEYEIYADRHFLRDGAPTEPAEYRPAQIPLADGELLTKSAQADLDAFSPATLYPYRSIVTRISPVASRPPSIYTLRWQGDYYQLWQRPPAPSRRILSHTSLGDSRQLPFCGQSTTRYEPLCAIQPAAAAPCSLIRTLARTASAHRAQLVAYQRPLPVVARADQTQWPAGWRHDPAGATLSPTSPGELDAHIRVASSQLYRLWLGGTFARGFAVSVDGHALGAVSNQLSTIGQYVSVGTVPLAAGVHTIVLRYRPANLTPGSGTEATMLSAIVLDPLQSPASRLFTVAPADATTLCGRDLDWVEVVAPAG